MNFSIVLKHLLGEGQIWFGRRDSLTPLRVSDTAQALFGVEEIDALQALPFGCVHELCLETPFCVKGRSWYPPGFVASAVLGRTLATENYAPLLRQKSLVAWVGHRVWPTPHLLDVTIAEKEKLQTDLKWSWNSHSMFLDPECKEDRLWTTIKLLSSPAVFAVFADGSGFNFIASRRLQLAAQKHNALCFLFRPPWEIDRVSCAHSKWRIKPVSGEESNERWNIELVTGKGLPTPINWEVEWKGQWQEGCEQNRLYLAEKLGSAGEDTGRDAEATEEVTRRRISR